MKVGLTISHQSNRLALKQRKMKKKKTSYPSIMIIYIHAKRTRISMLNKHSRVAYSHDMNDSFTTFVSVYTNGETKPKAP